MDRTSRIASLGQQSSLTKTATGKEKASPVGGGWASNASPAAESNEADRERWTERAECEFGTTVEYNETDRVSGKIGFRGRSGEQQRAQQPGAKPGETQSPRSSGDAERTPNGAWRKARRIRLARKPASRKFVRISELPQSARKLLSRKRYITPEN
jgi:hypothetical protein